MREYSLAKTQNVHKAYELIEYLKNRPKTEMVGLGLLFGEPGLGKSRFARQASIQNDYIYFRLEATMTAKSFASRLLEMIYFHFGMPKIGFRGTANELLKRCLDILQNYENTIIVIDEVDYAFKSKKILGSIRDIVDETLSIIILVGMADAKEKLLIADAHYFDRCNFFCEFKSLSINDMILLCKDVCDVEIDESVIRHLSKKTKGNIRKLIKTLYSLESFAKAQNITVIKPEHLDVQTMN